MFMVTSKNQHYIVPNTGRCHIIAPLPEKYCGLIIRFNNKKRKPSYHKTGFIFPLYTKTADQKQ
jgi:hypothetical protein